MSVRIALGVFATGNNVSSGEKKMVYERSVYEWNKRSRRYPVPAQEAGEYLEDLTKKNGSLTAKLVLDESRPKDATLHPCFEWDDSKAAESYRKEQARKLIGDIVCVKVITRDDEEEKKEEPKRVFVNVSPLPKEGCFKTASAVVHSVDESQIVLANALKELKNFVRKYEILKEQFEAIKPVFEAIDKFETDYCVDEGL